MTRNPTWADFNHWFTRDEAFGYYGYRPPVQQQDGTWVAVSTDHPTGNPDEYPHLVIRAGTRRAVLIAAMARDIAATIRKAEEAGEGV
ncbi:hypothetical protein CYL17_18605 (plasmid) [Thermobispora bispora]|nr:hypothetical protein CYL17_18605 [Thermobispora bispora]